MLDQEIIILTIEEVQILTTTEELLQIEETTTAVRIEIITTEIIIIQAELEVIVLLDQVIIVIEAVEVQPIVVVEVPDLLGHHLPVHHQEEADPRAVLDHQVVEEEEDKTHKRIFLKL